MSPRSEEFLEQARERLDDARKILPLVHPAVVVTTAYYAMLNAARAALSEHGRARSQRAQLARLRRRVEAPVKTLPFLFEPELGPEAARRLSKRLS